MSTGVQPQATQSTNPHLIVTSSGAPVVAWTELTSSGSEIRVAQYDAAANGGAGAWIALGNSLDAGGISQTTAATNVKLVDTTFGLVALWENSVAGATQIYARVFSGGNWTPIGIDSDSGTGISGVPLGSKIQDLTVAARSGRIAIAWSQLEFATGIRQIMLREFDGVSWNEIAGSATGAGASGMVASSLGGQVTHNSQPGLNYVGTDLLLVWQAFAEQSGQIVVSRYVNSGGVPSIVSITETRARAAQPQLVSNGTHAQLLWSDGRDHLYAKRWDGATFVEEVPGDASGVGISLTGRTIEALATSIDAAGRTAISWLAASSEDVADGPLNLMVRRNNFSITGNVYQATPGGDSIQQILDAQTLASGDVILVNGIVGGDFTITAADAGVTILGTPGSQILGNINIAANDVRLQRLQVTGQITSTNADRFSLRESTVRGRVLVNGGNDSQLSHNLLLEQNGGIVLAGLANNAIIRSNRIDGALNAISLGDPQSSVPGGASNAQVIDNTVSNSITGVRLRIASSGTIERNHVTAVTTALDLDANFSGLIKSNRFGGATVGVRYEFSAAMSDNDITNNSIGVIAVVDSTLDGFGTQAGLLPNRIDGNITGVQLSGQMFNQIIRNNTTGVVGTGALVSPSLELANVIEANTTGVQVAGRIEYQKIGRNTLGILASNQQLIGHNILYRNTESLRVDARNDVRIIQNTFYTPTGDHIRVVGGSQRTEIQNNILWTENGYNLFVANDSTNGFFSDFNVLHTSGSGKIGYFTRDFHDILDWQQDIYRFDLNSIGRTSVDPGRTEPRFVNKAIDDYRILDQVASQRRTSPTIDAGNPLIDLSLPSSYNNLLTNPSFESDFNNWTVTPSASIRTSGPAPFDGAKYVSGDANPTSTIRQDIDLLTRGFTAAQLDNGGWAVHFGARVRSGAESVRDEGRLTLSFLNATGNVIQSRQVNSANTTDRWELIGGRNYVPAGTRTVRFEYSMTKRSGATTDAFLDRAFVTLQDSSSVVDAGAHGNTDLDQAAPAHMVLRSPDLYTDWERDKPLSIRWDSFGNASRSAVAIDLYSDTPHGPVFVTNIINGTPDDGEFTWIAGNSGVNFGTYGLRIQLSLAENRTVLDRSSETFTVPESGDNFYVNDTLTNGDVYTTAAGSNRNTGKLPVAPKPFPENLLRTYSLGANQTLFIDGGSYPLINPLIVSNDVGSLGDDEGFLLLGSTSSTARSVLSPANPLVTFPVLELNDADLMTVRNLDLVGGTKGLWVRDISNDLQLEGIRAMQNSQEGFLIDNGSNVTTATGLTASNNQSHGVAIFGGLGTLASSTITANAQTGLILNHVGPAQVYGNVISGNVGGSTQGVQIIAASGGAPLVFGDNNLALGRGNRVFDNSKTGISASGNVQIVGNTIYGHTGPNNFGISAGVGVAVSQNVVFGNNAGIQANGAVSVDLNRVYNQIDTGINVINTPVQRNVVYNNQSGIRASSSTLSNNLVYANSQRGVVVDGPSQVLNNTLHQNAGEALRITSATGSQVINNILWANGLGGFAMVVTSETTPTIVTDYNLFYLTAGALAGVWGTGTAGDLGRFQLTSGKNLNSLSANPLFVDVDGADNILGYSTNTNDGRDDDFHLQSPFGSFKSGSFAPVASAGGVGVPVAVQGAYSNDTNLSPAIDAGRPATALQMSPRPMAMHSTLAHSETRNKHRSPQPATSMCLAPMVAKFGLQTKHTRFAGMRTTLTLSVLHIPSNCYELATLRQFWRLPTPPLEPDYSHGLYPRA